jgi:hypothetical protein
MASASGGPEAGTGDGAPGRSSHAASRRRVLAATGSHRACRHMFNLRQVLHLAGAAGRAVLSK